MGCKPIVLRLVISIKLNKMFAIVHANGYAKVSKLYCSKANTLNPWRTALSSQVNSVSLNGLFHDFLTVGTKPSKSMVTKSSMERTGCFAKSHKNVASKAATKNTVSEKVMSFSPNLSPNKKTVNENMPASKVTYAPAPPPPFI